MEAVYSHAGQTELTGDQAHPALMHQVFTVVDLGPDVVQRHVSLTVQSLQLSELQQRGGVRLLVQNWIFIFLQKIQIQTCIHLFHPHVRSNINSRWVDTSKCKFQSMIQKKVLKFLVDHHKNFSASPTPGCLHLDTEDVSPTNVTLTTPGCGRDKYLEPLSSACVAAGWTSQRLSVPSQRWSPQWADGGGSGAPAARPCSPSGCCWSRCLVPAWNPQRILIWLEETWTQTWNL